MAKAETRRRSALGRGVLLVAIGALAATSVRGQEEALPKDEGYRGIWYYNQPQKDEYRYKYSGGFATYPQQHVPIAIYSKEANKTFFVYGGRPKEKNELLHMVSYYDHATGTVPRPTILLNKKTEDAHDNPTLSIDEQGYLWIFSNSHGTSRPSFIHRSRKPYLVDDFERILTTNFSYGQPWHIPGKGFLFLHTRYSPGRDLFWMTSEDGANWNEPKPLAAMAQGHYQISWRLGGKLGTAFNYHPTKGGLNARTNLYYLESADWGATWKTADGKPVRTPLDQVQNPALVRNYEDEKLLVYLKDLAYDAEGRPVILYLNSTGYASGPANGPRTWRTARWTGAAWEFRPFAESDHNYDYGSLYVEADGTWRVIAATEPGPQPHGTGGDLSMWTSGDQGLTWKLARQLTRNGTRNHTYPRRPVDAHPDFYALWADGDALKPSESRLYFCNRDGSRVYRLPAMMSGDSSRPELVE